MRREIRILVADVLAILAAAASAHAHAGGWPW